MGRAYKKRVYREQPCKGEGCAAIAGPGRRLCAECKAKERGTRPCNTPGCVHLILPASSHRHCEICRHGSSGTGQRSGITTRISAYRKICSVCEGMSWRRDGRCVCGKSYAPEVVVRDAGMQRRDEPLVKF